MSKVVRVALLDTKTKRFIEYLVDTVNYKTAEDVAKEQALSDGFNLKDCDVVAMSEMTVLKGA